MSSSPATRTAESRSRASWASRSVQHEQPFSWVHVRDAIEPDLATDLAAGFPTDGYRRSTGPGGRMFRFRPLVTDSKLHGDLKSGIWGEFAKHLIGPTYRDLVAEVLGCDLNGLSVDAALCRYGRTSSLEPHTDQERRVATHVTYLTPGWEDSWGGALELLGSADPADVAARVAPAFNTAVLMRRSQISWHAVQPVGTTVDVDRQSLLVQFSRGAG